MFSQGSVILFIGGRVWQTPWADTLGRHPLGRHPRGQIHPLADTPPGQTPSCPVHAVMYMGYTPPFPVHAGIHTPTMCMLGYTQPPAQCMLGYTPSRRPLQRTERILLECILVLSLKFLIFITKYNISLSYSYILKFLSLIHSLAMTMIRK